MDARPPRSGEVSRSNAPGTTKKLTIQTCVDAEFSRSDHPDALKCGHEAGADKSYFEHAGTTPLRFWSTGLGIAFLVDLVITGFRGTSVSDG
jgi:hypothetical protein